MCRGAAFAAMRSALSPSLNAARGESRKPHPLPPMASNARFPTQAPPQFLHCISIKMQNLLIFPSGGDESYVSSWAVSYPLPEDPTAAPGDVGSTVKRLTTANLARG